MYDNTYRLIDFVTGSILYWLNAKVSHVNVGKNIKIKKFQNVRRAFLKGQYFVILSLLSYTSIARRN